MPYFPQKEEEMGRRKTDSRRKGETKGSERKRKRGIGPCCLSGRRRIGPRNGEVPAQEVNFACRYINLPNIPGASDWARKNWAGERSSIIDTGFNGGGMCSFSWLSKYVKYMQSFYADAKLFKKDEKNGNLYLGANKDVRLWKVPFYPYG